jgi:hypothetical protein
MREPLIPLPEGASARTYQRQIYPAPQAGELRRRVPERRHRRRG